MPTFLRNTVRGAAWLVLLAVSLMVLGPVPALAQDDPSEGLIALVAAQPPFDTWLPQHPGWEGDAWDNGDGSWTVEFHTEERADWLGYARVERATLTVVEAFAPTPLPEDVYAEQAALVRDAALHDTEVLAWLDNRPAQWGVYEHFNRWERTWELTFSHGVRAVRVQLAVDAFDNSVSIWNVYDANALDAQAALDHTRDSAIQLAYSAEGIWAVLGGQGWQTYAAPLYDGVWGVSFVVSADERVFVLVDVAAEQVLEVALR